MINIYLPFDLIFVHSIENNRREVISILQRIPQNHEKSGGNGYELPSDHTKIWSELSGSGARSGSGPEGRPQRDTNLNPSAQREIQRISTMQISKDGPSRANFPDGHCLQQTTVPVQDCFQGSQDREEPNRHGMSQNHPSNWVEADDEDNEGEDTELCVQSTPPYYEEQ